MLDVTCFGLLIGQAVGRWANFVNREAFGAVTDVFCRMGLTPPGGETIYVHPTFLYESLWNLLCFLFLLALLRRGKRRFDGQYFLIYASWYGLGRMLIEGLRTDSLYLFGTGVRVSQLLAAFSFLACAVLLIGFSRREKKPETLWVNRRHSAGTQGAENAAGNAG
jgi:phosphatidylglycerol:prolipoprotein diacylglycerol transferase